MSRVTGLGVWGTFRFLFSHFLFDPVIIFLRMKFGRQLLHEAYPQYRHFYLAYKDLKQAIKLITGADASEYSIKEVTSNFGNVPALAGSVFRPPESRFQELLNGEKEKINKFLEVTLTAVNGALRELIKDLLRSPDDDQYPTNFTHVEQAVDEQSEQLVFLQNYQCINHIGLRKITKKYDKHNRSNSSPWYMAQLAKEPFLNADFETPLKYLSLCYSRLRTIRLSSSGEISKYYLDQTKNDEEYDGEASEEHASSLTGSFDETDQLHTRKDQETPPLFEMQSNEEIFNRTPEDLYVGDSEIPVAHSTSSPVDLSETFEAVKQSKYLVRSDEIMRLKVLIVKFMALASIGSQRFSGRAAVNDLLHPLNVVKKPNMET